MKTCWIKLDQLQGQMLLDKVLFCRGLVANKQLLQNHFLNVRQASFFGGRANGSKSWNLIQKENLWQGLVAAFELLEKLFLTVSLSWRTVAEQITDMAQNTDIFHFFLSLGYGETTDTKNTTQFAIFVCGIIAVLYEGE